MDLRVFLLFSVFGLSPKGLTALIQTKRTVMAEVGEEAWLNCQLMQSKEVVQVTWQKLLPEREENLATNNKYFGQRVNAGFQGKVEFKSVGLRHSSIVIRNVTEEDEGCYHCLFNTHREGALTGTTCLQLYELHGPVVHVESQSAETAVSCSATGRPAPTVSLKVLRPNVHFSDSTSVSVTNTNATVTVNVTAVLPRFHDNSTAVECTVTVPSVPLRTVVREIPQSSADGFYEKPSSDNSSDSSLPVIIITAVIVAAVCVCVCVAVGVIIRRIKKSRSHKDLENIKTQQKTTEQTTEIVAPVIHYEQVRQRTPTETKTKQDSPKVSP